MLITNGCARCTVGTVSRAHVPDSHSRHGDGRTTWTIFLAKRFIPPKPNHVVTTCLHPALPSRLSEGRRWTQKNLDVATATPLPTDCGGPDYTLAGAVYNATWCLLWSGGGDRPGKTWAIKRLQNQHLLSLDLFFQRMLICRRMHPCAFAEFAPEQGVGWITELCVY